MCVPKYQASCRRSTFTAKKISYGSNFYQESTTNCYYSFVLTISNVGASFWADLSSGAQCLKITQNVSSFLQHRAAVKYMNFLASKLSTIWQMLEKISKTNSKEETFLMILNHCVSELDGGCKFSPSFFRTWKGLHFHMRNMEDLLAPIKCVALGWPTQLDHGHRFLHLSSFGAPSNFCTFVVVTIWCWYTAMWSVGERKRDAIYQIQITTHSKCDTWAASIVLAKHTYPNVTYPWPWTEKRGVKNNWFVTLFSQR